MSLRAMIVALGFVFPACLSLAQTPPVLRLEEEIPLLNVEGRIDHLSVDLEGQRVFIAALGNNSVEVVDVPHGQRIAEIKALKEPQGVLYVQANQTLYVANGADGTVRSFDARTMQPVKTVVLGDDADNLRFDAKQQLLLAGYGRGAIATLGLDLASKGDVKLSAHPESFQLSADGQRLFVNLPRRYSVAVVDRGKQTVSATWEMLSAHANFPMALDEEHHRLVLVCHMPAKLLILDTNTGGFVARVSTVGNADDLFYDPSRDRLYVIGGEGYVDVLHVSDKTKLTSIAHVATARGARTGLFVPEWNKLLVAAPHRGANPARLLVYTLTP